MLEVIVLFVIGLLWIVGATIQDIRKREVANWLNFSLIIFVLGFRFFHSLFSESSVGFGFFYQGLIGFGIFLVLGNLFYYGRLFAGGDAKLMIALGTVLPLTANFNDNVLTFASFLFLFLVSGAIYGLIFSLYLSLSRFNNFKKEYIKRINDNKKFVYIMTLLGLVLLIFGFYNSVFISFGILIFIFPYFYLYAKSVDKACMIKKVPVRNLTEGDWLCNNIKVGRKVIMAKWDGLSKKDIILIRKHKKQVLIKQGIPFVPVFLISFLILIYLYYTGNLFGFGLFGF